MSRPDHMAALTPEQRAACDAEATRRKRQALALIEEAQGKMGDACAILSTLQYASPEWKVTSAMYDRIKACWYKVRDGVEHSARARKMRLDPLHVDVLLKRMAARAAPRPTPAPEARP